jgi:hypothetical protein
MAIRPDTRGAPDYLPGGVWAICARCSFKRRRPDIAKEWTGLMVCRDTCWDPRPAILTAPNVGPEGVPLPDITPRPPDLFVDPENPVLPEDL